MLAAENAEYGFRRNLYGIRPFALAIAWASGLTAGVLFGLSTGTVERRALLWGPGVLTAIGCIALHLRIVGPAWVRLAGERYTDRLFEAARSVAPDTPDDREH